MSQEQLADLSVLCVENDELMQPVDFDDTIHEFAVRKARRKTFLQ